MTRIIAGFPGVGKTYFAKNTDKIVTDSDSSLFSHDEDFPDNYLEHIKELKQSDKYEIIMVSTHANIRGAMVGEELNFTLVYPSIMLKDEYIQRFRDRGSPDDFIDFMSRNWDVFIDHLNVQKYCGRMVLGEGMYLSDIIK